MQNNRKQPSLLATLFDEDHPAPHSIDVERSVLSACLKEDECVSTALNSGVTSELFYNIIHAEIFKAIESLRQKNRQIDLLAVCDTLRIRGELDNIGGEEFLAELHSAIATTANITEWISSLLEFHSRRLLIKSCAEIVKRCFADDCEASEIFSDLRNEINEHERFAVGTLDKSTTVRLNEFFEYIMELQTGTGGIVVPWGIPGFDQLIKVQRKQMMILAAGSNTGKTRFILNDAVGKINQGVGIAVFSHENSSETLFAGLISIIAEIPMDMMQRKNGLNPATMKRIQDATAWLNERKDILYVFGKGDYVHSPRGISLKVRGIQERTGGILAAIAVDYIQNLICDDKRIRNRVEQLDDIILNLSNISGDFNLFLLALSQLNRDKQRDSANKRPEIADIKGSSTIEQEADIIAFLHNPNKNARDKEEFIGDIQLDCYSRKVRGPNPFDDKLNFCTYTGKISGVASRYSDEDNPERI